MNIEHLKYILEVSRCQSISQASKNLFIGQSTLSNVISTFEHELGTKLFYRTNKGIRLTETGQQIIPELKEILSHQNNVHKIASSQQWKKTDSHILVYPVGEPSVMVALLGKIQKLHPQSRLHFSKAKPESIITKMLYTGCSIGLSALSEIRYQNIRSEANNFGFSCEDIYRDSFYLYIGKQHPLAKEPAIDFSTIIDEPFALVHTLITPQDNIFYTDFQRLKNITTFEHYESVKKAIVNYNYLTIAPKLAFYEDIYCQHHEIVQIPLTDFHEKLVNFLIFPKDTTQLSILEQDIITEIRTFFTALA